MRLLKVFISILFAFPFISFADDQGWTSSDRETFYHTDEGSQLIDYDFFKNLEQPNSQEKLADSNYLKKFKLFTSEFSGKDSKNPDGLPIGLTVNEYYNDKRPDWSGRWIGISCASCHTNQLNYKGKSVRIDGGTGSFDFYGFIEAINNSVTETVTDKEKLKRFISRLDKDQSVNPNYKNLPSEKAKELLKLRSNKISFMSRVNSGLEDYWGYGRMDVAALTMNAVNVTGLGIEENISLTKNPSKAPPLWYSNDFFQHHNVGLTASPIRRNSVQAIGGGASIDLTSPMGEGLFESNLPLGNLHILESKVSKLKAPTWPEELFGTIDQEKAARGKTLYQNNCVKCHGSHPLDRLSSVTDTFPFNKKELVSFNLYKTARIGTDNGQAKFFFKIGKTKHMSDFLYEVTPYPLNLALLTKRAPNAAILTGLANPIVDRMLEEGGVTPECKASEPCIGAYSKEWLEIEGYRDPKERTSALLLKNSVKNLLTYRAPHLAGAWATPPYLHNGSIPTIYELLSPRKERQMSFYLGSNEYDPIKMGFLSGSEIPGNNFKVKTKLKGNRSTGHLFQNKYQKGVIGRYLEPRERLEIIEYLKTNLQ